LNKNLDPNKENYSAQELDIERALSFNKPEDIKEWLSIFS